MRSHNSGDKAHHVLGRQRAVCNDERLGHLAGVRVGAPDDRDILDLRMREEQRFQLGGRDLEPLVLDEFLEPIDDVEVSVLIGVSDVPGVEPSVFVERLGGGVGTLQVSPHHLWPSDPHFTAFSRP